MRVFTHRLSVVLDRELHRIVKSKAALVEMDMGEVARVLLLAWVNDDKRAAQIVKEAQEQQGRGNHE